MSESDAVARLQERVRTLREERGWTQEQLAEKAGVSRNFIGMLERGETGSTVETMIDIAEAFGMTVSELFLGVHGRGPQKLARLSEAVAGEPADVQAAIFLLVESC